MMSDTNYKRVDLDALSTMVTLERESDAMQRLQADFFTLALSYMAELRTDADTEPKYTERQMLEDQARSTAILYIGFIERRIGKVLNYASLEAAGTPVDKSRFTTEEKMLFNALYEDIMEYRNKMLRDVSIK